jgi:uncharacterized protein YyaL (SSP411 family)
MSSRANDSLVKWREWSVETFREALEQDKPILLDIGAVWCHWCHVMDDGIPGDPVHTGTYSNPEIAEAINTNYIPIKVDNDRRPDINARYNMGGWPTTAFLTPKGEPLYGETYVYPTRMKQLLAEIAKYYRTNRDEIAARITEHDRESPGDSESKHLQEALNADLLKVVDQHILSAFDAPYGGFGHQPKFPHIDAMEYSLMRSVQTGDRQLGQIFERTLDAMAGGGMYDRFAGGFFRYSTTRDWSVPHFEKMLEDNAHLSRLAYLAARLTGERKFAEIGDDVMKWLTHTMLENEYGVFAGSQDADKEEAYYGLPLDQREKLPHPYIDRTIYLNWNALMVSSLCEGYRSSSDGGSLEIAEKCYLFLIDTIWPNHFFDSGQAQGTNYLLGDATALLNAALDLADVTGIGRYLTDAVKIGNAVVEKLADADFGGFFDMPLSPDAIGALAEPVKELASSSACASALLRLYAVTENRVYQQAAENTLKFYADGVVTHGLFGSAYGLALIKYLAGPVRLIIAADGERDDVKEMRQAAWSSHGGRSFIVEIINKNETETYASGPDGTARAYLCIGTQCTMFDSVAHLLMV